jgi:hypothetical protein
MSFKFEGSYLRRCEIFKRVNRHRVLSTIRVKQIFLASAAMLSICLPTSRGGRFLKMDAGNRKSLRDDYSTPIPQVDLRAFERRANWSSEGTQL